MSNVQAKLIEAQTRAQSVAATMTAADLRTLTESVGTQLAAVRNDLSTVVKMSLSYLMMDGTTSHINKVLEVVNEGDRATIQSLIQWATPYKMVSMHDDENPTASDSEKEAIKAKAELDSRKKVAGKDRALYKGGDKTREIIDRASGENYLKFMDDFGGCIWAWAGATAKARKTEESKARKAAEDQAWENSAKSAKLKTISEKMAKFLKKYENELGEDLIDELMETIDTARREARDAEKESAKQ